MLCIDYMRWVLRGLQDAVTDLYTEPRLAEYLLDAVMDWMIAHGQAVMAEIGDLIEFFWVGDDWGAQGGPFYSPELFRRVFAPRIAKLIGAIKSKTNAKCAYHCCGAVRWVIPDLIDAGVRHPAPAAAHRGGKRGQRADQGRVRNQTLFPRGNEQPGPVPRRPGRASG